MRGSRRTRRQKSGALQRRRLILLASVGALGYLGLGVRAVQLQALDADWLSARAEAQHHSTLQLGPLRGEIQDRNGSLLAVSADVESVAASPRKIVDSRRTANRLSSALKISEKSVRQRLRSSRSFVWIKRWIDPDEAERMHHLKLDGVTLQRERKRFYPSHALASAYLGFAGRDGEGLTGLELAFDSALRGASTSLPVLRDARGKKLIHWQGDPRARSGARIVTALDARLQHFAERALERALERTQAKHAMLVAIDPWNGDVLALAEQPTFNPNRFWLEDPRSFRARAFVDGFEPGSTLKPFTIAAALEAGVVQPSERFDCENGSWKVRDRVIHDFKPYEMLTVRDIVRLSSNIGAAKIADKLGSKNLVNALRRMGFGETTGSGFPGEAPGLLRDLRERQAVERANLAFGQGLNVTAMQLAAAGAVIANGGRRVWPRLVLRLEGSGGTLEWPKGLGERVMSEKTAHTMLSMLRDVVADGTGKAAQLPNHSVAGKTGTAQKIVGRSYSQDHFVASFLAIVPANRPRMVVVVVVDEPQGLHTGGLVAAPIFREFSGFAAKEWAPTPKGEA